MKKCIALIKDDTFCNNEIVRIWNKNERDLALRYLESEGAYVTKFGNVDLQMYALAKITECKKSGLIHINEYFKTNFILKEEIIKKYNLTEIDDYCEKNSLWLIYRLTEDFHIPYINIKVNGTTKHYTNLPMFEKLVNAVNAKQQPFAIEGTDWPYWFKFEGKLIPSNTSNWFKFLQTKYNYISPASLIPYTGDDMYDKHLTDQQKM